MRASAPKQLGGVLEAVIQNLGLGQRLKKAEALDRWSEIVGEQIARVTVPVRVEGDTLVVHVTSSVWRNELVFLKRELIAKINKAVQKDLIKDIIFR
jgi:predicted nucleic acid-binding Zn ribbon protein